MLDRMLDYTPTEFVFFVGSLPGGSPFVDGGHNLKAGLIIAALAAAAWLLTANPLIAAALIIPLVNVYFALRAGLTCGVLRRSPHWEVLQTTPIRHTDIFLARVSRPVRELTFLGVWLLGAIVLTMLIGGIFSHKTMDIFVLAANMLLLWGFASFSVLGSVLTAGAWGMYKANFADCTMSSLCACLWHWCISLLIVAGLWYWASAPFMLPLKAAATFLLLTLPFGFIGALYFSWHMMGSGPRLVNRTDRKRMGHMVAAGVLPRLFSHLARSLYLGH